MMKNNKPIDMKTLMEKLENITENYDMLYNNAAEIGETIAGQVMLADQTRAHEEGVQRSDPDAIRQMLRAEIDIIVSRIEFAADKYVQQRYR